MASGTFASSSSCTRIRDRLDIEHLRTARYDHHVGRPSRLQRCCLRTGRRIEHHQLHTVAARSVESWLQAGRRDVGDDRRIRLTTIAPATCRRLRVEVEQDSPGFDGQGRCQGRLPGAALRRKESDYLHET